MTGGPHNTMFVVWGIRDFNTIPFKPTQAKTGLEWGTRTDYGSLFDTLKQSA